MDFTQKEIEIALKRYSHNKEYKKNYYNNKYHNDVEYQTKMKEYSKNYYQQHKEKRKESYEANKGFLCARRKYNYYKKSDSLDTYKTKYPEEWEQYFMQNSTSDDHPSIEQF